MAYNNNRDRNFHPQNNNQPRSITKDFFNPYTFVPLSDKVFLLDSDEKERLAQDVPFKDGNSGSITIDFESMTPFCVCGNDGMSVNLANSFFIPGTSLKGMIRNVFEIVTLSNIRNGVANNRYSMRDLRNNSYELKSPNHPQKSGFLFQVNGKFYIKECSCEKYTYKEIEDEEKITGLKFCKSAKDKYGKLKNYIIEYQDGSFSMWFFSGFMNNKKHEYLFDIPKRLDNSIPLHEKEYDDFIFIHEKENENASWKFWKRKLKNYKTIDDIKRDGYKGIVPCFFRTKTNDKGETCVKDLGFSFLYRQPYEKTIHDFLPSVYHQEGIDMTQAVFGFVKGSESLKGRVQFGHSFIKNAKIEKKQTFIMGSPKPTYYPFYLEQSRPNVLQTYFSNGTRLSGFKRYLIQEKASAGTEKESKVTKSFVPLSANTKFTVTINFHNLKDYELGALIAAITFCNQQSTCYHSLGLAKAMGYGKLRVIDYSVNLSEDNKQKDFYRSFITKMCDTVHFKNEEEYLRSISYLFKIASGKYNPQKKVRYPILNNKEFETIKNQKLSLQDFAPY